ncbi:MAG TPA: MBL fold metallo-hydrolase [Eoetvoesiella sp.]
MRPLQLFDSESSSYTYIVVAQGSNEAIIIDPVDRHYERDLLQLERLNLRLMYILETHVHADHITSAGRLRQATGAKIAVADLCRFEGADIQLQESGVIRFGVTDQLTALCTPGHTAGSMSFLWHDNVFTGDSLMINGCGRTDFQGGSAKALYESVVEKLFALPDNTLVWPGHDYNGHFVSSIAWEKKNNRRFAGRRKDDFIDLMANLQLAPPRMLDVAVPANRKLGVHNSFESHE